MRTILLLFFGWALAGAQPRVVAVNVDGIVHPITVEIVTRALEQAQSQHADLLLIRLNTPGGLMEASREVVQKIVASPLPVVTFVTPSGARAASAGFFILESADLAAMASGTNTGAASPVLLGQQMDPVMRKKVENDATAWLRSITARRGRNNDLAEKAVIEAKAFSDKEALDQHLIEIIASSEQDLFTQLDGREITRWNGAKQKLKTAGAVVTEFQPSLRERIVTETDDPNLAFILLVLGALGIYVEFTSPGLIVPGVIGAVFALLGLSGLSVLPINWVGAALLILAMAFFILEAKFATHGILGVSGAVCMALGALMLVDGPPDLRIHLGTALGVTIPFALITMFLVSLVLQARRSKVITGLSSMLHEIGEARTPLAPEGQILIRGEYWNAVSPVPIAPGDHVRVTAINGLTLTVEPWATR
jgi:membrane-bound serine protease (ClpP class)